MPKMRFPLVMFLAAILLPPVNLLPMFGSAIRLSDLWIVLALIYIGIIKQLKFAVPNYVRLYFLFIVYQFAVSIAHISNQGIVPTIFTVRLVEYFCWFIVGYYIANHIEQRYFEKSIKVVFVILIFWGALDYFDLLPKFGKFQSVYDRISANTGGPYEFAVVISFFIFFVRIKLLQILGYLMLLLTQARITILATTVLIFQQSGIKAIGALSIAAVLGFSFLGILPIIKDSRYATLPNLAKLEHIAIQYYDVAPIISNKEEYKKYIYEGNGRVMYFHVTGMSLEMRLLRWSTAIKSTIHSFSGTIFGMGPGFFGVALDGQYIRVFCESGFVGLMLFLSFLFSLVRTLYNYNDEISSIVLHYFLMMVITALFIDIFVSERPMMLLWTILGFLESKRRMHEECGDIRVSESVNRVNTAVL